ncbi:MAG: c-type cytochrome, partial [Longimicrobiales bacterium]|nr:c-type cytochrome [Longimicrobiales bacterium]
MTPTPTSKSGGSRPIAFLSVACVVGLAVWWGVRAAERRALEEALLPYAAAALPAPDAPVDAALADVGARVFDARCAGCHALRGPAKLGPNLAGITLARDLAWVRSMVMDPDSMTRTDPIARALLQ